jgi:NitT/TauT family transport system substrate-binding protein
MQFCGDHQPGRRAWRAVLAVILALAAVGFGACGDDDSGGGESGSGAGKNGGLESTSLKVGILKIGDVLPYWAATEKGFFKKQGLTVETVEMAGGAAIQPAVQSGQLDLGWSNVVSVVLAKSKGFDFRFFTGGVFLGPDHYQNQTVLVKKDSPIANPAQLVGKTIGFNLLGGINELAVRATLQRQGIDPKKVKMVELGTPQVVPPLVQGRVDAVAANEPQITIGRQNDSVRILMPDPFRTLSEKPFLAGFMSTSKWLDEHPKTAAAFSRAIAEAGRWVDANPDDAHALLSKHTGIPAAVVNKMTPSIPKPTVAAADIQPWINAAKEFGLTSKTFPPNDVLWQPTQAKG